MHRPRLAITMGDPAGIGPEILAAAWGDDALHALCAPVAVGHPEILRQAARLRGVELEVVPIDDWNHAMASPRCMPCWQAVRDDVLAAPRAQVDPRSGQAAYDALIVAIDAARQQHIDGIVTGPLSKVALASAGHRLPGHTEILAERTGVRDYAMMLYLGPGQGVAGPAGLGVIHVTLHTALSRIFSELSSTAIVAKIELAHTTLAMLAGRAPRLGVCALNPHAGENGLFGDEEALVIRPAVEACQRRGIDVVGPLPADTLLVAAREGAYDGVVAMYHDQGHIALKLLGMHQAVNVTLGLPIVRTSVAHGTAFDIAWQGRAEWSGLIQAARVAARLAAARGKPPSAP